MGRAFEDRLSAFEVLAGTLLAPETHTVLQLAAREAGVLAPSLGLDPPFDPRLGKALVKTASYLLQEDPRAQFCLVCRDELHVLLELDSYRVRRSLLGELTAYSARASARLSAVLGDAAPLQARLFQFPHAELAEQYFELQQASTREAALRHHYVRLLGERGVDIGAARQMVEDMEGDELGAVLQENGLSPDEIPGWQTKGTGVYRPAGQTGSELLVDTKLPAGTELKRILSTFLG